MKIFNNILKVVLCLLIVTPILGVLGVFPEPTAELYNNPEAFTFIKVLFDSGFVVYLMAIVFAISIILTIKNQMALVALLILPITLNIVGFHLFLDGGLHTSGAIMGNVLFLINIYFLWQNRDVYQKLWKRV